MSCGIRLLRTPNNVCPYVATNLTLRQQEREEIGIKKTVLSFKANKTHPVCMIFLLSTNTNQEVMILLGVIFSIIAGAAMSFQGVMNTRLSEKIGLYESNLFVQGSAFILSLIAVWLLGKGDLKSILEVNKLYWLGGVLGLVITITVMLGIKDLSPTVSISIILISQLLVAAIIDAFGLMGSEKIVFHWTKFLGIAIMTAGVIVFKLRS